MKINELKIVIMVQRKKQNYTFLKNDTIIRLFQVKTTINKIVQKKVLY